MKIYEPWQMWMMKWRWEGKMADKLKLMKMND